MSAVKMPLLGFAVSAWLLSWASLSGRPENTFQPATKPASSGSKQDWLRRRSLERSSNTKRQPNSTQP